MRARRWARWARCAELARDPDPTPPRACSACRDTTTQHKVAIKKVSGAFENEIESLRVLREIKLLRTLNHENVRLSPRGDADSRQAAAARRTCLADTMPRARQTLSHT